MVYRILLFLSLASIISGCYRTPAVEGFDPDKWQTALENCTGYRSTVASQLLAGPGSPLLSLNQNELKALLGKASQHELFSRNQKFFYYQLDCQNSQRLSIRFNALGNAQEVTVQKVSK